MLTQGLRHRSLCLALSLLVVGCSSEKFSESGFLPSYKNLKVEDAPTGGKRMIWVNPDFKPANYHAAMLDPVVFYPEPKPTPQVSTQTLDEIKNYMDTTLRSSLESAVVVTNTPGPGVAHMSIAITAVAPESESLAFYQYIPIALAITGAMALAEGGLPQEPKIAVEVQIVDSVSKKPLLLMVRGGTGEKLKGARVDGDRPVAFDALKKLFDGWAKGTAEQATKYISHR